MNNMTRSVLSASDVLKSASEAGVQFSIFNGNLRLKLPKDGVAPDLLDGIKLHKPEILALLQKSLQREAQSVPDIVHSDQNKRVKLTDLQESIWIAEKLADTAGLSNYCSVTSMDSKPDIDALDHAYKRIIERHIPLRTSIKEDQIGSVYQTILQNFNAEVICIEQDTDDSKEFDRFLKRVSRREFDFANELKLLLYLVEIDDHDFRLVIVTHHLFTDGWSIGLLMDEITFFYNQYLGLEPRNLPEIEATYFDYAAWANNRKQSGQLLSALNYWENRLKEAPVIHALPLDRSRPLALSFEVASLYSVIPSTQLNEIKSFAVKQGVTLYTLMLAAYIVVLTKYSGESRHVIGTSVANRDKEVLSPLIGLFTHTMPMMFEVDSAATFTELLKVVQKNYLADMQYQGIPIEDIIRRIGHDTSTLSYAPLMQIAFFVQNNDFSELALHGINSETSFVKTNVSLYDLGLSITEVNESLELEWTYSKDLFNPTTVERLAAHYNTLVEQLVKFSDRPLNSIQMMSEGELATIAERFSHNDALEDAVSKSIERLRQQNTPLLTHKLFEKCVERYPEKIAVWSVDSSFTYHKLNTRANQLAHWIVRQPGFTPGSIVGVALEKSVDLIIALLAVMKAGGAYLPLDPKFPPSRLAYMQADSNVALVLGERQSLGNISGDSCRIACLDDLELVEELARQSTVAPDIDISEHQLVYVLYTSGSTGQPKGVMIEHHSLVIFLLSVSNEPGITVNDRLLAISSISFDIHTLEIFLPLTTGATLYFASSEEYADQSSLSNLITREGISIMQATPSTWRILLDSGWQPIAPIKALCGGEALPEDIKDRLIRNGNLELWNMYGPTEATVWCCTKRIDSIITLGRPTAGAHLYVLDEQMESVAIGVRGQLYIGGSCLARGYMNLPALTQETFVQDISRIQLEPRLYRTGDYVKWTEEGELVYLGRGDSQVKIRGHRIEISEITKVVNDLPYVREAAVVVREGKQGGKFLASYIVPHDSSFTAHRIRTDISEQLPEYMVPTVIEMLELIPHTPNGKVDYERLKKMEIQSNHRAPVHPTTPTQRLLAELWEAVLPVTVGDIGIHDSFYSLGGNSMSALVFVARAKAKGLRIKPSELMKYPTIAQLEEVCSKGGVVVAYSAFTGEAPLTVDQKSILYLPVTRDCYFINVILDTPYSVKPDVLAEAMDAVIGAHESLRANFIVDAYGCWKQKIASQAPKQHVPDFNLQNNWEADSTTDVLKGFLGTLHSTMSIHSGPLMSAALVSAANGEQKILFSISHLICDGFSLPIVIEDIFKAYKSLIAGDTVELPAFVSMDKWIFAYDDYIRSQAVQSSLDYWESLPWHRLKPMALDYPQSDLGNTMSTAKTVSLQLEPKFTRLFLSSRLQNLGVDHIEILVHVLACAFTKWTGGEALFVNVFDTGRNLIPDLNENEDLSRTVAAFAIARALFLLNNRKADNMAGLLDTKSQIANIPLRGFSYRMLLHSEENKIVSSRMKNLPTPEIWLNYYGVVDSIKAEQDMPTISSLVDKIDVVSLNPKTPRNRTLFLPWNVSNGKLNMVWEYSDKLHSRETIIRLAELFKSELIKLLEAVHGETGSTDEADSSSITRSEVPKANPVSEVASC